MRPTPLFAGKGARGRTARCGRRCGRVGPDGYRVPGRGAALSWSRRSAVIVAMHDTDATTAANSNAGGLQRRGLGPAQGEQREPGGSRSQCSDEGAQRRTRGVGGKRKRAAQRSCCGAGSPGAPHSQDGRRRTAAPPGTRWSAGPAASVPAVDLRSRCPITPDAPACPGRVSGHRERRASRTRPQRPTGAQPRAERSERARRPAAAWPKRHATPGRRRLRRSRQPNGRSGVPTGLLRRSPTRGRGAKRNGRTTGDGGLDARRVSPELPRGLAAAGGDGAYRTGATLAGAQGGSSCRDGATGDGASGAAWLRVSMTSVAAHYLHRASLASISERSGRILGFRLTCELGNQHRSLERCFLRPRVMTLALSRVPVPHQQHRLHSVRFQKGALGSKTVPEQKQPADFRHPLQGASQETPKTQPARFVQREHLHPYKHSPHAGIVRHSPPRHIR